MLSNGWDDATAALQLLSHLEGATLNVPLLVPMSRRTLRTGLVDVLSAHYGSPGRLADYRRQFEKTTRSAGKDPSIFAIALETLAFETFGDMGQTAHLRLIRDCFIAGHNSPGSGSGGFDGGNVPMVETLLQRLVAETQPAPVIPPEPVGLEKLLRSYLTGKQPRQRPIRQDWNGIVCVFMPKDGS